MLILLVHQRLEKRSRKSDMSNVTVSETPSVSDGDALPRFRNVCLPAETIEDGGLQRIHLFSLAMYQV
ncbi:hypothetical protein D9M72_631850 [compost metagenome]